MMSVMCLNVRHTRVWYMMLQKSGLKFSLKGYLQLGYRSIANHGTMYFSHGTNNHGCFELDISCSFEPINYTIYIILHFLPRNYLIDLSVALS